MILIALGLMACGDGRPAVRDYLEKGGLKVLAVDYDPADQSGSAYTYAGNRPGKFCTGSIEGAALSIGWASDRSSTTSEVCSESDGAIEALWRCDHLHDGMGCNNAGADLGKEGKADAVDLFRRGCDLGVGLACKNRGVVARDGLLGEAKNEGAAEVWLERACALKLPEGCWRRGLLGRPPDDPMGCTTSRPWMERGAALGSAEAWNSLGVEDDRCPDGDGPKAREEFRKGCDSGLGLACWNLADMLAQGRGGAADTDASLKTLAEACDATSSDRDSCIEFGFQTRRKADRTAEDNVAALAAYRKACDAGLGVGCRDVGLVLRDGDVGVAADPEAALGAFWRGCDMTGDDRDPECCPHFNDLKAKIHPEGWVPPDPASVATTGAVP